MSKKAFVTRYVLLVKKLKQNPYSSLEEIEKFLETEFAYMRTKEDNLELAFSKRTLQRDIREIKNLFGIDIVYSRLEKGYFIAETDFEDMNFQRMMEAFDVFNSLNMANDLRPFIHLENRQPQGTEHLYGILHAIKFNFRIEFAYKKFIDDESSRRMVEPLALKEFKQRWYLIAYDKKDHSIKSFGLDRMWDLSVRQDKFRRPENLNINDSYKHCFGIISPNEAEPREIILSFVPLQGKYIKSLPLHESQRILVNDKKEFRISLKLFITHDFVMELLSYGEDMVVIKPKTLANKIRDIHKKAALRHS